MPGFPRSHVLHRRQADWRHACGIEGEDGSHYLTGGIAYSDYCVDLLREQISYLAPVVVIPGEDEMGALAENALGAERDADLSGIYRREADDGNSLGFNDIELPRFLRCL